MNCGLVSDEDDLLSLPTWMRTTGNDIQVHPCQNVGKKRAQTAQTLASHLHASRDGKQRYIDSRAMQALQEISQRTC